jgi:hypothetical protein
VRLSNRALFLGAVLVGSIAGVPAWTMAKGQWCNNELVRHKVSLTAQTLTVAGVAMTPPAPAAAYDVTSGVSDPDLVNAHLFCAGCPGQVASRDNLERQP